MFKDIHNEILPLPVKVLKTTALTKSGSMAGEITASNMIKNKNHKAYHHTGILLMALY